MDLHSIAFFASLFLDSLARAARATHLLFANQGATPLVAHAEAFLRSKTVDLTFDGEQDIIDALDRLGRDRRFCEPCQIKEKNLRLPCAQHAPSMIGPPLRLASWSLPAGVGVGLHQSGIAGQVLLRMRTATIGRI